MYYIQIKKNICNEKSFKASDLGPLGPGCQLHLLTVPLADVVVTAVALDRAQQLSAPAGGNTRENGHCVLSEEHQIVHE